jgi:hypothetical protein
MNFGCVVLEKKTDQCSFFPPLEDKKFGARHRQKYSVIAIVFGLACVREETRRTGKQKKCRGLETNFLNM